MRLVLLKTLTSAFVISGAVSLVVGCSSDSEPDEPSSCQEPPCPGSSTGGTSSGAGGTGSLPPGGGGGENGGKGGSGSPGGDGSGGLSGMECSEAETEFCENQIAPHCGYTAEYWKDQGEGCLVNTEEGFRVEWSGINNLLGRKGVRPGTRENIVHYEADYQPEGNSYLCVYGWTQDPLVEYYIVESWGSWRPPGGEGFQGTLESDGGVYDIYLTERVEQPSIEGTRTFYQYWSVRQEKREKGSVTVENHFAAWENLNMNLGSLYEVSMCVEGYQSSGKAEVKMVIE